MYVVQRPQSSAPPSRLSVLVRLGSGVVRLCERNGEEYRRLQRNTGGVSGRRGPLGRYLGYKSRYKNTYSAPRRLGGRGAQKLLLRALLFLFWPEAFFFSTGAQQLLPLCAADGLLCQYVAPQRPVVSQHAARTRSQPGAPLCRRTAGRRRLRVFFFFSPRVFLFLPAPAGGWAAAPTGSFRDSSGDGSRTTLCRNGRLGGGAIGAAAPAAPPTGSRRAERLPPAHRPTSPSLLAARCSV